MSPVAWPWRWARCSPRSLISFLLVHATDGSPGAIRLGVAATPAKIAAENHALGWDRPLVVQFFDYLRKLLSGDLGTSLIDGRSIGDDLLDRLPVTASIALFATLPVRHRRHRARASPPPSVAGRFGRFITSSSGVALSLPAFWVGILLVYLLSLQLGCCRRPDTCSSPTTRSAGSPA